MCEREREGEYVSVVVLSYISQYTLCSLKSNSPIIEAIINFDRTHSSFSADAITMVHPVPPEWRSPSFFFSAHSGVPNVVEWPGHLQQWHSGVPYVRFSDRVKEVDTFYNGNKASGTY